MRLFLDTEFKKTRGDFMNIAISSGHGKYTSGAIGIIDEVTEARKVVSRVCEYLRASGVQVFEYHDDTSRDSVTNLNAIVNYHNSKIRDLDVSVHFNASAPTSSPIGTEVWYYTEQALAAKVSAAISKVSGLRDRGSKQSTGLFFLNSTDQPAILIEVCFVDSSADVKLYQEHFDDICKAIAETISNGSMTPSPPSPAPSDDEILIAGDSVMTAGQLATYFLSKNPNPKIKCSIMQLMQYFINEGIAEGIRGDIAACQTAHETGWLNFGGKVTPDQNNFAGIGSTNDSDVGQGAWFDTPQIGVRAQIQHLKAYCNKLPLNKPLVDPRFNLVTRGVAPRWIDLNGRWAVPGTTYGQSILKIFNNGKNVDVDIPPIIDNETASEWAKTAWDWASKKGFVDGTRPHDNVTREQVVVIIYRILNSLTN